MDNYIIAYDLGTGGNKAALYDINGEHVAEDFVSYQTFYPRPGWHEQCPEDWWEAVVKSTQNLLLKADINSSAIAAIGISGHSLGVVPLDSNGRLLRETTPIWSDARATDQASKFFVNISESEWYNITGNGFPAPLYSVFKIMWYRDNEPDLFSKIYKVIGTKDYINHKLTNTFTTDYSYASGTGVYDLVNWRYSEELIHISKLPSSIFPEIVSSSKVIGNITPSAAEALGLSTNVKVVAGGVDNSCMAMGARNIKDGRIYNSQGSSSWIAVTTSQPILDDDFRPFVFTAAQPGLYNSAVPVFSAGSSFGWVKDHFCVDLVKEAKNKGVDVYDLMTKLAAQSTPGANGIIFNPSLGGGSSVDESINIRGALLGLDLGHTREDVLRATMEGVALEMRMALDLLRKKVDIADEMLVVGGGSRSDLWRQIYADIYKMRIIKTNIDQQAASLGAAALAAVGAGFWKDFDRIDKIHEVVDTKQPIADHVEVYEKILPVFIKAGKYLAKLGDDVADLDMWRG